MGDVATTILTINANLCMDASKAEVGLEAKCKAAMRAVREKNWMERADNDDALLRAAVGGVLLDVGSHSEDGKRLIEGLDALRKLSAFLAAAQAGINAEFPEMDEANPPIPLLGWWHETK